MRINSVRVIKHQPHAHDVIEVDGEFGTYVVTGGQLEDLLIGDGQMCEYCHDEGVVSEDVFDADSGQYMRGAGSRKCVCRSSQ